MGEDEGFVPMDAPPLACRSMASSLHGLGFRVHGFAAAAATAWLWRRMALRIWAPAEQLEPRTNLARGEEGSAWMDDEGVMSETVGDRHR